ncbi:hypothetical protein D3C72_2163480 [compost metagenome]
MASALVVNPGFFQTLRADWKPAPIAKPLDTASQPPVKQRTEDVAQCRHPQQQPDLVPVAGQQTHQHGFGLQGQQCRRAERGKKQPDVRSENQCAG